MEVVAVADLEMLIKEAREEVVVVVEVVDTVQAEVVMGINTLQDVVRKLPEACILQ